MRSRLRARLTIVTLAAAIVAAAWLVLSAALLPEPPVPREILLGAEAICLVLFAVIGGLSAIEARALHR